MAKGDHLVCSEGAYQHHAIDLGDGNVIQYGGADFSSLTVEIVPWEQMSRCGEILVLPVLPKFSPDQIVQRALSRLGEDNYCLFNNNCEHFVNWCRLGVVTSRQVDRVVERAVSASAKLSSRAGLRLVSRSGARWIAKRIPSKAMPMLVAADFIQLGVEVVAANHGKPPEDARRLGQFAGLGASTGIGAMMAGPFGAIAGAGLWAIGEVVGKISTRQSRRSPKS